MDAVRFIEERNRMCKAHSPDCEGCRIDEAKPVVIECALWALDNPEKAVKIVEEWAAAHPRRTRQDVFLEQWPEAYVQPGTGVLDIQPCYMEKSLNGSQKCCGKRCADCRREFWMQEVE